MARLPRVALHMAVAGVNLLLTLCCLCLLVPGARADWETVYCETNADSIDVDTARKFVDNYLQNVPQIDSCCINSFDGICTHFEYIYEDNVKDYQYYYLGVCGNVWHCDNCLWVAKMWQEVVNQCAKDIDGVDRVGGYVAYDWSPGVWMHYRIWRDH